LDKGMVMLMNIKSSPQFTPVTAPSAGGIVRDYNLKVSLVEWDYTPKLDMCATGSPQAFDASQVWFKKNVDTQNPLANRIGSK
jgi:hypothetical protein